MNTSAAESWTEPVHGHLHAPFGIWGIVQMFRGSGSLIYTIVRNELVSRHRLKLLGSMWSLLDPLCFMLVYYFLFHVVLQRGGPGYILRLWVGLTVWQFVARSLSRSAICIPQRRELLNMIAFPKLVLPTCVVLSNLFDLGMGLMVLMILLAVMQVSLTWMALHALWIIGVTMLLTLGLAYLVAVVGVYLRDTQDILNYLLRMVFFMCPIIYIPTSGFHAALEAAPTFSENHPTFYYLVYRMNPFYAIFESLRATILEGRAPEFVLLGQTAALGLTLLMFGMLLFQLRQGGFAKYL